jgi:hypothetical protein
VFSNNWHIVYVKCLYFRTYIFFDFPVASNLLQVLLTSFPYKMSRFWAAESSSEGEQGSDSDSFNEAAPAVRLADKKFGATFEESDSGM